MHMWFMFYICLLMRWLRECVFVSAPHTLLKGSFNWHFLVRSLVNRNSSVLVDSAAIRVCGGKY